MLPELFKDAVRRLKKAYEQNRHYYNLRYRDVDHSVGDKYCAETLSDASGYVTSKRSSGYIGPFKIKKRVSLWI